FWKARVTVDERGDAAVEFPLNDSLTSFRVVAVATGGPGTFGTASATIRSSQDLMVLPGIAPLVREGDRIRAEVTLRNTTGRRVVRVQVSPSLFDGADTIREWMRRYRYTCLEQRVSKAVALRDVKGWETLTSELSAHLDGDSLLKYFPTMTWGSEVLTAYVL